MNSPCEWDSSYNYCFTKEDVDCGQLGDGESCESKTWGEDRVPACQSVTKCSEDWSSYEAEGDEC